LLIVLPPIAIANGVEAVQDGHVYAEAGAALVA
jgi:hypothetical protein